MAERPVLYYITDRTAFAADEPTRRKRLLGKIAEAAHAGVDYIQLREKDLPARELESIAREAVQILRDEKELTDRIRPAGTALLVNSRNDIALAVEADGVHLRSDDISPETVRRIWEATAGTFPQERPRGSPMISVSCHSAAEVAQAAEQQATFAVFAPVFEKADAPNAVSTGLARLREACRAGIPVLALGGVTIANSRSCLEAGAAGIAAIRLFQENEIADVVKRLGG